MQEGQGALIFQSDIWILPFAFFCLFFSKALFYHIFPIPGVIKAVTDASERGETGEPSNRMSKQASEGTCG